jgi:allophanate hydrolase
MNLSIDQAPLDISWLRSAYADGATTPTQIVEEVYSRLGAHGALSIWIHLVSKADALRRAEDLEADTSARTLPLYGVPFAVKDNIDVVGMPTTAGCAAFAYTPSETAFVVQCLLDAGAILIGKTNLDQFATGLVGMRSPFGACSSVFDKDYISGGSSSGSAVAVATGLVSFSLGTDTAGSGRVPAAFNNLIGLKPTRGLVSASGVVPACRTLDCVSIFALTAADAQTVLRITGKFDRADAYSRPSPSTGPVSFSTTHFRFGVPAASSLEFFGDEAAKDLYESAVKALVALGGEKVEIDYEPFRAAANLLYSGPWVAERLAAIESFVTEHADDMHPTVHQIISGARRHSAVDTFSNAYRLADLKRQTESQWSHIDILMLPTTGTIYTKDAVENDPIKLNTNLGYYTNFVNLLDLTAVAVPAGFRENGLPFGVSLIGPAFSDDALLRLADRFHRMQSLKTGSHLREVSSTRPIDHPECPAGYVSIAVVGAHLAGQPLNYQLTERNSYLIKTAHTAANYRLFALSNTTPPKPGLVRTPGFDGSGIELEVWAMPEASFGGFVASIPPPLSIGTVELSDGSQVKCFLCEPFAIDGSLDITGFGGWRAFRNSRAN